MGFCLKELAILMIYNNPNLNRSSLLLYASTL